MLLWTKSTACRGMLKKYFTLLEDFSLDIILIKYLGAVYKA